MGLNIVLNAAFTYTFIKTGIAEPLAGLALASSVASVANLWLLKYKLKGKVGKSGVPSKSWVALFLSGSGTLLLLLLAKPVVEKFVQAGTLSGGISIAVSGVLVMVVSVGLFFVSGGDQVRKTIMKVVLRGR